MRSPSSSESARVMVSLPVRRRVLVAAHRSCRLFDLGAGRRGAGPRRLLFLFDRTATLPAAVSAATLAAAALPARSATSRRDSSSLRRCASSSERWRASLGGAAARLLFLDLGRASSSARRRTSSAARCSSSRRRSASAWRRWRRASSSALCASCTARTRPARSSAVRLRGITTGRRAGSACAGGRPVLPHGRPAPLPRACRAPASPARSCAFCAPRPDGLGAAMREALADLAGLDAACAVRAGRRGGPGSAAALSCSVALSVISLHTVILPPRPAGKGPSAFPTAAFGRKPASRAASSSRRRHSGPEPSAACTTCSRPKAAPISAAVSTHANGKPAPAPCSLRRPPSAPSTAASSTAALPPRNASQTRSKPATARPARRASPIASQHRCTSRASTRSASASGTATGCFAPRARRAAWPPPAPLYRAAPSTTNPVRAAAPRDRARSRRRDRRRSAIRTASVAHLAGDDAAALRPAVAGLGRDGRRCGNAAGARCAYSCPRRRPPASGSSSNQWARAAMMMALACFGSSSTPPLSAPRASRSARRRRDRRDRRASSRPFRRAPPACPGVMPVDRRDHRRDAELVPPRLVFAVAPFKKVARALLQLVGDVLVEAFDARRVLDRRRRRLPRPR